MIRGTTPQHTFTLPFEPPEGSHFRICYGQGQNHKERILFERTTESCRVNGSVVSVRLTAKETLLFDCTPHWIDGEYKALPVKIQFGIKTPGDEVLWSEIIETTVERCLRKDGVV